MIPPVEVLGLEDKLDKLSLIKASYSKMPVNLKATS